MNCMLSKPSKFHVTEQRGMSNLNTLLLKSLFLWLLIFSLNVSSQNVWIGGSGDWNVSSNWSSGSLPIFTDDVEINTSLDKVTIPNGYAARAKSLSTESGTLLDIEDGGFLNFKDGSEGIYNKGIITCSGTINFRKPLLEAIVNDGIGTIKISTSGIVNIDTSGDEAIVNFGAFENSGLVDIDSTGSSGFYNSSDASLINHGSIDLNAVSNKGIDNQLGVITNYGFIEIRNSPGIGLYNVGIVFNNNSILIDSVDDKGVDNNNVFHNQSDGSVSISNTGLEGFYNHSEDTLRNYGDLFIYKSMYSGLYNEGIVENYKLLSISSPARDGVFNADSIYNAPEGTIEITNVLTANRVGFNNFLEEDALTNDGLMLIDSVYAGLKYGRVINNGTITISRAQDDAIYGFNRFNNNDSIIIFGAETGVDVDASNEEDGFINNGFCSITNTTVGIDIDNGFFANSGSVVIDNASDKGVSLVISLNQLPTTFINEGNASVIISNAGQYGLRLSHGVEFINSSNSLLHIYNTSVSPLDIDEDVIFEGFGEIIIEN